MEKGLRDVIGALDNFIDLYASIDWKKYGVQNDFVNFNLEGFKQHKKILQNIYAQKTNQEKSESSNQENR